MHYNAADYKNEITQLTSVISLNSDQFEKSINEIIKNHHISRNQFFKFCENVNYLHPHYSKLVLQKLLIHLIKKHPQFLHFYGIKIFYHLSSPYNTLVPKSFFSAIFEHPELLNNFLKFVEQTAQDTPEIAIMISNQLKAKINANPD